MDADDDGTPRRDWAAARWFADFQRDFAARLQWTVTSDYTAANHHPVVAVAEGTDLSVAPGAEVTLNAQVTDPDGDDYSLLRWWQYREAGTSSAELDLVPTGDSVRVRIPAEAVPGTSLHIILEITDSGTPALTSYQRVVVDVAESTTD